MSPVTMIATQHDEQDPSPPIRIWRLQYGPCWCRSIPNESSSFDYVRFRQTAADLGSLEENLLIVSERVIDGSAQAYRQVHSEVPDPKLVISAGTCPSSHRFWDELPNGWTLVDEILPVDIRVDDCISGNPESLMAAVVSHVLTGEMGRLVTSEETLGLSG